MITYNVIQKITKWYTRTPLSLPAIYISKNDNKMVLLILFFGRQSGIFIDKFV